MGSCSRTIIWLPFNLLSEPQTQSICNTCWLISNQLVNLFKWNYQPTHSPSIPGCSIFRWASQPSIITVLMFHFVLAARIKHVFPPANSHAEHVNTRENPEKASFLSFPCQEWKKDSSDSFKHYIADERTLEVTWWRPVPDKRSGSYTYLVLRLYKEEECMKLKSGETDVICKLLRPL